MDRRMNGIFLGALVLASGLFFSGSALHAAPVVVSDAQVVETGEKDFLLKLRSSGPQAFDAVQKNPTTLEVRLYHATLGELQPLETGGFGGVTFTQEPGSKVLVKITLNNAGFKTMAKQGDNPNTVEVRVLWAPDLTPPVISAVNAVNITSAGAKITWTTNEPSDSQVVYGISQPEPQTSNPDTALVTAHQITLSGLTAGKLYYYRVLSRDEAGNLAASIAGIFTTASAGTAYQESGGRVVMEAEKYDSKIPRGGKDWTEQSSQAGFSGAGYMAVLPNTGASVNENFTTTVAELAYRIKFTKTGTYAVWVRGRAPSASDDSLHAGLDGASPASCDRMTDYNTAWKWSRKTLDPLQTTLVVSTPGIHTFHIWMREDGFEADKIILTLDGTTTPPAGLGPAESTRA